MASLHVLESRSSAWSSLGCLWADLIQAPSTWMTPRSLNQSSTRGPWQALEVVADRRRGGESADLDNIVLEA
eukprot:10490260-Heterocapsa_arctica.AAC.1